MENNHAGSCPNHYLFKVMVKIKGSYHGSDVQPQMQLQMQPRVKHIYVTNHNKKELARQQWPLFHGILANAHEIINTKPRYPGRVWVSYGVMKLAPGYFLYEKLGGKCNVVWEFRAL